MFYFGTLDHLMQDVVLTHRYFACYNLADMHIVFWCGIREQRPPVLSTTELHFTHTKRTVGSVKNIKILPLFGDYCVIYDPGLCSLVVIHGASIWYFLKRCIKQNLCSLGFVKSWFLRDCRKKEDSQQKLVT